MSEVRVPDLGESIVEATVGTWLKKPGDAVGQGEAVVELETDKVNVEVVSEVDGVLESVNKQTGDTVGPGDVLAVVAAGASAAAAPAPTEKSAPAEVAKPAPAAAATPASAPIAQSVPATAQTPGVLSRATPAVRRLAQEQGVSLQDIQGTGGQGRITPEDVIRGPQTAAPAPAAKPASAPAASAAVTTGQSMASGKPEERVRMSRRRLTIAKRLVEAQHTAAMLTTFNEVDMTAVMAIRKRRKDDFKEKNGVGLGFMSFFTKAVVGALKFIPQLNAEISGDDMVVKKYYDIGVAVATDAGLVVPVVRDADRLSFADIERSIADLAKKARSNSLGLNDLQGGTFTITNGGVFGSLLSTPILNAPQVGILGMHKIQERPVAVDGRIELRPMMYLALSYDHRIVDGSEAVRFLVKVKELLEDPEQLLLEG